MTRMLAVGFTNTVTRNVNAGFNNSMTRTYSMGFKRCLTRILVVCLTLLMTKIKPNKTYTHTLSTIPHKPDLMGFYV